MSKIEVDQVDPQSGTTLTLGTSGDTIVVPSGVTLNASNATLTGFSYTLSYTKGTFTGDNTTTDFTIDSGRAVDDV